MKTITDDYEGFLEDGGWNFLEEASRTARLRLTCVADASPPCSWFFTDPQEDEDEEGEDEEDSDAVSFSEGELEEAAVRNVASLAVDNEASGNRSDGRAAASCPCPFL